MLQENAFKMLLFKFFHLKNKRKGIFEFLFGMLFKVLTATIQGWFRAFFRTGVQLKKQGGNSGKGSQQGHKHTSISKENPPKCLILQKLERIFS